MKKVIFFILSIFCTAAAAAQDEAGTQSVIVANDSVSTSQYTLEMADSAYVLGEYTTAAAIYEKILATQGVSPALYMNLGNSYFKMDEIAKAILNYERAILLNPADEDVRFNLELARTRIVDTETAVNELFVVTWFKRISVSMNVSQWGVLTIILMALMSVSIAIYFLGRRVGTKKAAFALSVIFLILTAAAFTFASSQKKRLTASDHAVIMSPSVTVKSTPNNSGTELFIIHEGRKVQIIDSTMKDWVEIRLSDGNEGWIPVSVMEII